MYFCYSCEALVDRRHVKLFRYHKVVSLDECDNELCQSLNTRSLHYSYGLVHNYTAGGNAGIYI